MCGLFGVVSWDGEFSEKRILAAHCIQAHRGPDGNGTWRGKVGQCQLVLGHQRLSILDLSESSDQPMVDLKRNSVLIYNGELYNFVELREELEKKGESFHSTGDTEVFQTALHAWEPERAFSKANGMWALAWLDQNRLKLVFSRDRGSEKPLYYCWIDSKLFFASEIKTILALTGVRFEINSQVAGEYLIQALVDTGEDTFFKGIKKVPAGTFCEIDLSTKPCSIEPTQYWTCPTEPSDLTLEQMTEEVREIFIDSVRIRLRSDVPTGVLLSGGLDSSAIVAAVNFLNKGGSKLQLLSATSPGSQFDESQYAISMAKHVGADLEQVQLDLNANNAMKLLETVSHFNDEPVISFSSVLHYLLMIRARELGVTVVLSGQGADELLCGYRKYLAFYIQALMREGSYIRAGRTVFDFWKNKSILPQFNLSEGRRYLPGRLRRQVTSIAGPALADFVAQELGVSGSDIGGRQLKDVTAFSVPSLCHYEDRMSMSQSREIRLPFLDPRLMELLIPAPVDFKLRHGWTKYVFRRAMSPMLPPEITWRKDKQGFISPQGEWLKNELRKDVGALFAPDSLMVKAGLINITELQKKFDLYVRDERKGSKIWFREIMAPLALEVWLRQYNNHLAL